MHSGWIVTSCRYGSSAWAASSVCEIYQSRWAIEVFFKQIKQTLHICWVSTGNPMG